MSQVIPDCILVVETQLWSVPRSERQLAIKGLTSFFIQVTPESESATHTSTSQRRPDFYLISLPQKVWVDLHIVKECAVSTYLQGIDIEDQNLRIGKRHGI